MLGCFFIDNDERYLWLSQSYLPSNPFYVPPLLYPVLQKNAESLFPAAFFLSAGDPGKRLKHGKKRIPGPLDLFLLQAASLGAASSDISEMTE